MRDLLYSASAAGAGGRLEGLRVGGVSECYRCVHFQVVGEAEKGAGRLRVV